MNQLNNPYHVQTWKFSAIAPDGHRNTTQMTINENLTGAVLGDQRPARITFRMALWIIHGWNQLGHTKYRLIVPNPGN